MLNFWFSACCPRNCRCSLSSADNLSHAVTLRSHELATVALRCEVGVLVGLRSLFTASHLALVKRVAGCDGVLISRHGHANLALLK